MTTFTRALVGHVCRLLEPDEREAVEGDIAELRMPGAEALREVLGLAVRRQAALWTEWGPWLALVGVVIPLGALLGQLSWPWADESAIYTFLYVNNWTWAYVESPGARRDLLDVGTRVCLNDLALIGWSWTTGFALGSLSRRTLWVTATLFCLVVLVVFGLSSGTTARANPFNAAVFSLPFYRIVYPWLVLTGLVLLPGVWGMRRSRRSALLPLIPTLVGFAIVALLTVSAARTLELFAIGHWHLTRLDPSPDGFIEHGGWFRPLRLLPLLPLWPVAFIVASACWRRLRGQPASA